MDILWCVLLEMTHLISALDMLCAGLCPLLIQSASIKEAHTVIRENLTCKPLAEVTSLSYLRVDGNPILEFYNLF